MQKYLTYLNLHVLFVIICYHPGIEKKSHTWCMMQRLRVWNSTPWWIAKELFITLLRGRGWLRLFLAYLLRLCLATWCLCLLSPALGLRLCLALHTGRSFDLEGVWQACGVLSLKVFSSTNSYITHIISMVLPLHLGFKMFKACPRLGLVDVDIHFATHISSQIYIFLLNFQKLFASRY